MSKPQPQLTPPSVEISEVCRRLNALADQVSSTEVRVLLTNGDAPVAMLMSIAELARLDLFARQRAE